MQKHDSKPLDDYIEYTEPQMLSRSKEWLNNLRRRHSIRQFSGRPVSKEIIQTCIKTAGTAPSGANHQPWHFCAISSPDVKQQIRTQAEMHERRFYSGAANDDWLEALKPLGTDAQKPYLEIAPWLIAVFSQKKGGIDAGDKKQNYYIQESVGIATGFLLTALHNAGLATLTHTPKPMSFLSDICQRPLDERAFMLIVTGYPASDASVPEHALCKKTLNDISTFL
ncbi:MAG: nitroreductase family protein [Pseudomonadota bacterium]